MAYKGLSREEKMQAAQAAQRQRKEEDAAKNMGSGAILDDGVPKVALHDVPKGGTSGKPSLIRIMGRYAAGRRDPTDAKEIFVSDIAYLDKVPDVDSWPADPSTARRRTMRCIWPARDDDRPSLLWRLHDKVMDSSWDRNANSGQGSRIYHHAEGDTKVLFDEIAFCGKPGAKIKSPWFPKRTYLLNVIDRAQEEWHRENKSTLLLCSKRNAWTPKGKSEEIVRWSIGLGTTAYNNQIYDEVVDTYGFWDEYDILLWKLSEQPYYKAKHFSVEPEKTAKLGLTLTPAMIKRAGEPLTDEEMSYDLIDFDRSYPVTSYRQIRAKLGYVFMKCDELLHTHFYEELESLAESESDELIDEDPSEDDSTSASPAASTGWEPKAASPSKPEKPAPVAAKEEPAEERRSSRRADPDSEASSSIPWDKLEDGSFNGKTYLGVQFMTPEHRSMVLSVKEDGSFEYVKEWPLGSGKKLKTLKNTENGFYSPENFTHCPLSGASFLD